MAFAIRHHLWLWLGAFRPWASSASKIPEQIFTYWDSPSIPLGVQVTLDTWQRHNPSWQIHVVSPATLGVFLSPESVSFIQGPEVKRYMSGLGPPQMADILRVELLAENGGVWLDATAAVTESFDKWLGQGVMPTTCLHGFDLDFQLLEAKSINLRNSSNWTSFFQDDRLSINSFPAAVRMPENWGFAAASECETMRLWRKQLRKMMQHPGGVEGILKEEMPSMHPVYQKWMPHLLTGSYVLSLATKEASPESYRFLPAEDWAFRHLDYMPAPWLLGPSLPLDYFTDYAGGAIFALARSTEHGSPGPPRVGPLLKLRKFDRCALNAIVAYRSYAASSPLASIYALTKEPRWWPPAVGEALAAFEANHCGTTDRFLQIFFASMRMLCSCLFFCNDHPCLSLAVCVTCLRLCRFAFGHPVRKTVSKER